MAVAITTPFEEALERIDRLSIDDQEALMDIVRSRIIERRRRGIVASALTTLQAFRGGRASYGTVDDLRRELEA